MLATIRSNGAQAAEDRVVEARRRARLDQRRDPFSRAFSAATCVATGSMSVASTGMCASLASAMASTALPVPRSSALRGRSRRTTLLDHLEAARRRAVMAGAEGQPGLDLDGEVADAAAVAVVRAVHEEAAGAHRLQTFQRPRHPVDVGQHFAPISASIASSREQRRDALPRRVGIAVGIERDFVDARASSMSTTASG